MTADLEAVTRTLEARRDLIAEWLCDHGTGRLYSKGAYRARADRFIADVLAPVLASLPDDRLAEAERWADQFLERLIYQNCPTCGLPNPERPGADCDDCNDLAAMARQYRAALSGGDATPRPEAGLYRADGSPRGY